MAVSSKPINVGFFTRAGYPGTFDNPEKEHVTDETILKTLPELSPTLQAFVKLQRLTGLRGKELYTMRVGDINEKWEYWFTHKTIGKTKQKRRIVFNPDEQAILMPYLKDRKADEFVFSPPNCHARNRANAVRQGRRSVRQGFLQNGG